MTAPTRAEAVAAAGEEIARSLARQAARSPSDAAREALGRGATEEQLTAWIARHRPAAVLPPAEVRSA